MHLAVACVVTKVELIRVSQHVESLVLLAMAA